VPKHRKDWKFRRTGRHAAPSQMEAVAQKAVKAVPSAAMVGALAIASQAHPSARPSRSAPVLSHVGSSRMDGTINLVALAAADSAAKVTHPSHPIYAVGVDHQTHPVRAVRSAGRIAAARTYIVQPGDTLSGIAFRFYGRARSWNWLYQVNRAEIANPNLIFPGQVLQLPRDIPTMFSGTGVKTSSTVNTQHSQGGAAKSHQPVTAAFHGTLGCGGLEALWRAAGGASSAQVTAASIAMAESSGNQYATGPFGERGYWQINPDHGSLSTYDAYGNARAAIIISDDGTNWSPWTTFTDGAYLGRC
jgi:LysM repeat protein